MTTEEMLEADREISRVLGKRPGESINDAAMRVVFEGKATGLVRDVAKAIVVGPADNPNERFRRAAALLKAARGGR